MSSTSRRRPLLVSLAATAVMLLSVVTGQVAPPSDGAPPDVPQEYIQRFRRLQGDRVRFCIYPDGLTGELDRQVALAIGETLLIETEIYEVSSFIKIPGLGTIPISEDELFVHLTNNCDAFLGFTLGTGVYDPWITISQPYVSTRFVAVTLDERLERLGDLPAGEVVGTTMLTEGDAQVGSYIRSLPQDRRWRHAPYPYATILIERLVDGDVDVAVAWEPAVAFAAELHGADVREVAADPVSLPRRDVGIVLRSDQLFVRDAVDAAIAAMIEDGVLDAIYERTGFPGTLPR